MAQAAVDLPDPEQKPVDPMANPDELLSQLAGNEIDRLLAEADGENAHKLTKPIDKSHVNMVQPEGAGAQAAAKEDISASLDGLLNKVQEGESAATLAELSKAVDSELEANQTQATAEAKEREALLKAAGFEQPGETPAAAPAVAQDADPEGSERQAMLDAAGFESPSENLERDDQDDQQEYAAPLPVYLKPLEWINIPIESLPPSWRALGKLAIITMVNAVAVIGYVLIFRKH